MYFIVLKLKIIPSLPERFRPRLRLVQFFERMLEAVQHLAQVCQRSGEAEKRIQIGAVVLRLQQQLMFMLTVQIHQQIAELLQQSDRHRLIVDETASFAAAGNFATDQQNLVVVHIILLQKIMHRRQGAGREFGFEDRFFAAAADHLFRQPLAQQPAQGAD